MKYISIERKPLHQKPPPTTTKLPPQNSIPYPETMKEKYFLRNS
jgi:hypothetical protein